LDYIRRIRDLREDSVLHTRVCCPCIRYIANYVCPLWTRCKWIAYSTFNLIM